MVTVEKLQLRHIISANDDIRLADRMEWLAGCGHDVIDQLSDPEGLEFARAAVDADGRVLCFWGVDAADGWTSLVGNVWLVATNEAERRAISLHRHLKSELDALHALYPVLTCWADSRNTKHHEWLKWLGFHLCGEKPYGLLGLPYKHFIREV